MNAAVEALGNEAQAASVTAMVDAMDRLVRRSDSRTIALLTGLKVLQDGLRV
jgi:hypothetical protein